MTYEVQAGRSAEECASEIRQMYGEGEPRFLPQVTIECTGIESSIHTAVLSTATRGVVMIIGVGKPQLTIPSFHLLLNEAGQPLVQHSASRTDILLDRYTFLEHILRYLARGDGRLSCR